MKVTGSTALCILLCFSCFPLLSEGGGQCFNDLTSRESFNDQTHLNPTWPTLISKPKNNLNPTKIGLSENEKGNATYPSTEEMVSHFITCAFLLILIATGYILRSKLQEDAHLLWPRDGSGREGRQPGYPQRMYAEDLFDETTDINNNNDNDNNNNNGD